MTKRIEKQWFYQGYICLLVIGIYGYGISHIWGMCIYPDEFGYWSTAARLAGWDWSQISSLGSYYSFGYSIILYPILLLTADSVTAYRAAILVNAVLMCVASFLLQKIGEKIFPQKNKLYKVLISGISVLYPSWILYMQATLTESMLMFMVVLVGYLFFELLEKPTFAKGLLLVLAVGYTYTLHMRTVGLVIACGLTVLIWGILEKKHRKKVLVILSLLAAALLLAYFGKEIVQSTIYAESNALNINDYGGQVNKVKQIFSLKGIQTIFLITAGKVIYLTLASGGLFVWGLWWSIKHTVKLFTNLKKQASIKSRELWSLYLVLLFLGTLGINCIYTINSVSLDNLLYGRYLEFVAPLFVFLGGCCIKEEVKKKSDVGKVLFPYLISFFIIILCLWNEEIGRIRGIHSAVLNVFTKGEDLNPLVFVLNIGFLALVYFLITLGILWYINKKQGREIFLVFLLVVNVLFGVANSDSIIYVGNENIRMDLTLLDLVSDRIEAGCEVSFLLEGDNQWISFLQMQLREKKIKVLKKEEINEFDTKDSILFVYWDSKYLDVLDKRFDHKVMGDLYYLYY